MGFRYAGALGCGDRNEGYEDSAVGFQYVRRGYTTCGTRRVCLVVGIKVDDAPDNIIESVINKKSIDFNQ